MKISTPGIYRDFPSDAYFADPTPEPSLNQTTIKVLLDGCPEKAKHQHPRLTTVGVDDEEVEKYIKSMAIGNAAHALMLGRGKKLTVIGADDFRGKEAKAKRDEATAAGNVPILEKHMADAELMVQSALDRLGRHEDKDAFTAGDGEVMIAWQENGIWFRSLVDWLHADLRTVDDYKTGGMSVAPYVLGVRADNAGWQIQAAFIERGLDILDPKNAGRRRFRFIAQENTAPFLLSVMHMNEHWLTMGRKKVAAGVALWMHALETGEWSDYGTRGITPEYPGYSETKWLDREISGEFDRIKERAPMLTDLAGG